MKNYISHVFVPNVFESLLIHFQAVFHLENKYSKLQSNKKLILEIFF